MSHLSALSGRIVLIAALAASVGLSGCGRKGALEAPPSAAIAEPPPAQQQGIMPNVPANFDAGLDAETPLPQPPTPPKRRFFLDWLLN